MYKCIKSHVHNVVNEHISELDLNRDIIHYVSDNLEINNKILEVIFPGGKKELVNYLISSIFINTQKKLLRYTYNEWNEESDIDKARNYMNIQVSIIMKNFDFTKKTFTYLISLNNKYHYLKMLFSMSKYMKNTIKCKKNYISIIYMHHKFVMRITKMKFPDSSSILVYVDDYIKIFA